MQNESHPPVSAVDRLSRGQPGRSGHLLSKGSRWTARSVSLVVLAIWGFFIVAHMIGGLTGGGEEASQPLRPNDYVGLAVMEGWLVGLILGWRWEPVGGTIAVVAYAISAVMNPNVLSFPFLLIPTAGVLYIASWWIRRTIMDVPLTPDTNSRQRSDS